jgi:hypothetical protein
MLLRPTTVLLCSLLLTSCATILNKRTTKFSVTTCEENTKLRYNDSVYTLPQVLRVKRSSQPLRFTAFNDSLNRDYEVRRKIAPQFSAVNFAWAPTVYLLPIAFGIDLTNPKRFNYGPGLDVSVHPDILPVDTFHPHKNFIKHYLSWEQPRKNKLYFSLSMPIANNLLMQFPGVSTRESTNGGGLTSGFEFYYTDRKAIGINAGIVWSRIYGPYKRLAPLTETFARESDTQTSFFFSAFKKHQIKRFAFSYGPGYAFNVLRHMTPNPEKKGRYGDYSYDYRHQYNQAAGFEFTGYHYINSWIQFGVVYRPTFVRVDPSVRFLYQHSISFDIAFKLFNDNSDL